NAVIAIIRHEHIPIVIELDLFRIVEYRILKWSVAKTTATGSIQPFYSLLRMPEVQDQNALPVGGRAGIGMEGKIQEPGFFRIDRLSVLRSVRPRTVAVSRTYVKNLSFHGFGIYFGNPSIPEPGI